MCAPISEPFSTTTTVRSAFSCFSPDRRRKTRRSAAHDHHVVVHAFALGQVGRFGHREFPL
jgi:hypothetical protein